MKRKAVWFVIGGLALAVGLGSALLALRPESDRPTLDEGDLKKQIRSFWQAYNRATELRTRGKFSSAVEFYQQTLVLNPKHEDSLYYLGNCLFELGEYARAVSIYEQLVEVNPRSNRGFSQLGIVLSTPAPGAVLDFERARRAFEGVTEINQEESGPFLRLGLLALHQGKLEEAMNRFLTAAGFKSPEGYFLAGYVKFSQGSYAEAAGYFQKVLEINAREKQISGRGVFSEGDVKPVSSKPSLTPLERSGLKALVFLSWTAAKLGGYPHGVAGEFRLQERAKEPGFTTAAFVKQAVGRASWADYDGDGDLDLAAVAEQGMLRLYRNQRGGLQDVTQLAGLPRVERRPAPPAWQPVWGDYNGDGRQDIYVMSPGYLGVGSNALYRNSGSGRFTDVTAEVGLGGKRATAQAVFLDYDRDGKMDIVEVGNAVEKQPPLRLFHNESGRFQEDHQRAKMNFSGNAVDVAVGDYDDDGWQDLFVLRWKQPGLLYRNTGNGTFSDMTQAAGLGGVGGDGFSALFFDYDRDGLMDLLVTSQAPYELALECLLTPDLKRSSWTPRLFRNRGSGQFEEVTTRVGLDRSYGTMQAAAVDVDQDGWTDIVLANGGLEEYRLEPSVILRNSEGQRFIEEAHWPAFNAPANAQSVAAADFDGDGQVELYFGGGFIVRLQLTPPAKISPVLPHR
ncbi:MAG: VCBS repeat-containing protein [Acidobacteria bacterium]|nr:VCBS repeat-containing protein [Acidobacteriota bacterium]